MFVLRPSLVYINYSYKLFSKDNLRHNCHFSRNINDRLRTIEAIEIDVAVVMYIPKCREGGRVFCSLLSSKEVLCL